MRSLDVRTVRRIKTEARNARHEGKTIKDCPYGVPEKESIWKVAFNEAEPSKWEGLDS